MRWGEGGNSRRERHRGQREWCVGEREVTAGESGTAVSGSSVLGRGSNSWRERRSGQREQSVLGRGVTDDLFGIVSGNFGLPRQHGMRDEKTNY